MQETKTIAIFADFENIALGVKEINQNLDIQLILERLLDKGRVLVKRAYADWQKYRFYRRNMHEAGFELIEVPHVSYSGKNSADIHMVCDALDLCYTRDHIDTFVILSGDSDFSPLVRRLRENNKLVIGIGVKMSTSNLLVESCDEFFYYDDIQRKKAQKRAKQAQKAKIPPKTSAKVGQPTDSTSSTSSTSSKSESPKAAKKEVPKSSDLGSKEEALSLLLDVIESLFEERDSSIWGSQVKQVIKRRKPNFDESYYGYRNFSHMLEDAQTRELIEMKRDKNPGQYYIVGFGPKA